MEELKERILKAAPPEIVEKWKNRTELNCNYSLERDCEKLNELKGELSDYDCDWCHNKGIIYSVRDDSIVSRDCNCMFVRNTIVNIRNSGLEKLMQKMTFDTYKATEPWQEIIHQSAMSFSSDPKNQWFFVGGQVGAGKTHICTAIVGELMNQGYASQYMLWHEESVKLKSIVNDQEYTVQMEKLKTIPALYIDDLFKRTTDNDGKILLPTAADVKLAFEILNYRYVNEGITIISSERTIDDIIACDEAVGSRIRQRAKYSYDIQPDIEKNYRLRG